MCAIVAPVSGFSTGYAQVLVALAVALGAGEGRAEPQVEDRVATAGAAFVGAATGGLIVSGTALMLSSSLGFGDDARSLALVLGLPPLAAGGGALGAAWMAGADPPWWIGVAGLSGAALAAGGVAGLALAQPRFLDDDLATTLLVLVGAPAFAGALAAAAVAPFCAVERE
jgi:hypothetical protein